MTGVLCTVCGAQVYLIKVEQEVQIAEILSFLGTINVVRTVLRIMQLKIRTNCPQISKAVTSRLLLNHQLIFLKVRQERLQNNSVCTTEILFMKYQGFINFFTRDLHIFFTYTMQFGCREGHVICLRWGITKSGMGFFLVIIHITTKLYVYIYIVLFTHVDIGNRTLSWNALMYKTPLSTGGGVGTQLSNNLIITPI